MVILCVIGAVGFPRNFHIVVGLNWHNKRLNLQIVERLISTNLLVSPTSFTCNLS
jgi:hypothetical protein